MNEQRVPVFHRGKINLGGTRHEIVLNKNDTVLTPNNESLKNLSINNWEYAFGDINANHPGPICNLYGGLFEEYGLSDESQRVRQAISLK